MAFSSDLAELYQYFVLDCIIELVYKVSHEFSTQPDYYKGISANTATELSNIRSKTGQDPDFPSKEQRKMLYKPIFGSFYSEGGGRDNSQFQTTRLHTFKAAKSFSENAQPTGFPMHRERIRSSLIPFEGYLNDLSGGVFDETFKRIEGLFNKSVSVLKDKGVYSSFRITEDLEVDKKWPFENTFPARRRRESSARLIEEISGRFANETMPKISKTAFFRLQRISILGNVSLDRILDSSKCDQSKDTDLDALTSKLYAWASEASLLAEAKSEKPSNSEPSIEV